MRNNLIKYKITFAYTGILVVVLVAVMSGLALFAEHHYEQEAKTELKDEISDFCKDMRRMDQVETNLSRLCFYDDGVTLSIYDREGKLLAGLYPDDFPIDTPFEADRVREAGNRRGSWMFQDHQETVEGKEYWIRGCYTLSSLKNICNKIISYIFILVPVLALLVGLLIYRMIRKSLFPVFHMTQTVKDITQSTDLSLRLPEPETRDELACLTETFNYMLKHLEDVFERERQFTSDAAHELRTPLSVIISHCEYCLEDMELEGELREELVVISRKARSMSKLVSRLLVIARAESGNYQPDFEETDLKILTETVLEELEEKAEEKHIRLELICDEPEAACVCDFGLITQLLMNLAENAIRYGRESGHVQVTLRDQEDSWDIEVRDDGIGIPEDAIGRIWDRFYRVDASRSDDGGFGLGLFLVKWIAGFHGGTVGVRSMVGLGSIFTVCLPKNNVKSE